MVVISPIMDEYGYYVCTCSRATDLYIWCIAYLCSNVY